MAAAAEQTRYRCTFWQEVGRTRVLLDALVIEGAEGPDTAQFRAADAFGWAQPWTLIETERIP